MSGGRKMSEAPDAPPCPFCGGDDIGRIDGPPEDDWVANVCRDCHARGPHNYSDAQALAAWSQRANVWQPIETAPKDGTSILAVRDDLLPCVVEWISYDGKSKWCVDPETFMEEEHFHEYFVGTHYDPTHWQPLPSPPCLG